MAIRDLARSGCIPGSRGTQERREQRGRLPLRDLPQAGWGVTPAQASGEETGGPTPGPREPQLAIAALHSWAFPLPPPVFLPFSNLLGACSHVGTPPFSSSPPWWGQALQQASKGCCLQLSQPPRTPWQLESTVKFQKAL